MGLAAKMILGLLACWAGAPPQAQAKGEGRVLTIALLREFEPLHPSLQRQPAAVYLSGLVNRHLMSFNHNAELKPDLLVALPRAREEGAAGALDRRGYALTLQLREEAVWGDGQPVTGYDVQFAVKLGQQLAGTPELRAIYDNIAEVRVDSYEPRKLVLYFKVFNRKAYYDLTALRVVPKHIEEAIFNHHKGQAEAYQRHSSYNLLATKEGLYNGPYLVREFLAGRGVVFERNPHFYGDKPLIDRIELKYFAHFGDLEEQMKAGAVQLILPVGLDFQAQRILEEIVHRNRLAYQVTSYPSLAYEHIDLQVGHPVLADVRVRRALNYGINKELLIKQIFHDRFYVAHHFISPLDRWYTRDASKVTYYPYNEKKAQILLTEAGWKMEKDGWRWRRGKKLTLQIASNEELFYRSEVLNFLKEEWQKLGIELVVRVEPGTQFFGDTVKKAKYPSMALFAWEKPLRHIPRQLFHSSAVPDVANGYKGENTNHWLQPRVDYLLDSLENEWDLARAEDLMQQIVRWYTLDVPTIPLFFRAVTAIKSSALVGYHISGHATPETFASEYWSLLEP